MDKGPIELNKPQPQGFSVTTAIVRAKANGEHGPLLLVQVGDRQPFLVRVTPLEYSRAKVDGEVTYYE